MASARLCKRFVIAGAVLLFAAAPAAFAHGGGRGGGPGGNGGHGGHAGAVGGGHVPGSGGRVVVAPGPHVHHGGGFARGPSPAFHRGHWVHGFHGGSPGWWWVGAGVGAPLYVQPVAPAAVLVQPQALYYCSSLQAYYPDVLTCPEPWLLVETVPGSMPQ